MLIIPIYLSLIYTFRFQTDSQLRVDFNQKCAYPGIVAARWLGVRLEMVGGLVIFFAALFAVLGREAGLGGEAVGLSISYALNMTLILSMLVRFTAEVETNIVANERIEEYSNVKTEAEWITKAVVSRNLKFSIRKFQVKLIISLGSKMANRWACSI